LEPPSIPVPELPLAVPPKDFKDIPGLPLLMYPELSFWFPQGIYIYLSYKKFLF
jgi:hypothetical protein